MQANISAQRINFLLDRIDGWGDRLGINVPPIVQLDSLRPLPANTFGQALVKLYDQAQLTPLTTGPRRKQLHDCVHVLTNYGTDPIGEAELQAFLLGCKLQWINVTLGLGLLRMIHRQYSKPERDRLQVQQRLYAAYQRGQNSTFDIDQWQPETQWQLPLKEVRALYRLD